ncbi:MAG: ATP synthase F1 subunit epsilon [Oscillospiraceae bacterium]
MHLFNLQIVTPDGLFFDGDVIMINIHTLEGWIGIRARHTDFLTALGMGECRVDLEDGTSKYAACIGGMVAVVNGQVRVAATTFEWAESIDAERANAAKLRAESIIASAGSPEEKHVAEMRLRRALVRLSVTRVQ